MIRIQLKLSVHSPQVKFPSSSLHDSNYNCELIVYPVITYLKIYIYNHIGVCLLSCSVVSSYSLQPHGLQPARLLSPWDSPGKNTGVGCPALFQGIFPTQGSNPCVMSPALAGRLFTISATWEAKLHIYVPLESQQKQDQELTMAQIMNSLLPNSDLY